MVNKLPSALVLASFLTWADAITVWLAGDSTMAATGAADGATAGWGAYLPNYLTGVTVVNDAIAGRSARSYTREGRFTTIANSVKSGDYVIIEFGHNDGGSPTPTDNGRSDCPVGSAGYSTTCSTVYGGVAETVLTYEAYYVNAANLLKSKGANVILSSPTVDNPWETGTFEYTQSRFVQYGEDAASATGSTFVNHELYVAQMWQALGASATDADFPNDHTHTSPSGANLVAQSFITALKVTSSTLKNHLSGSSTTATASKTTTTATTSKTTTTAVGGTCASLYGQCGGIGWTGATCCTGSTCTSSNPYYSQCL